MYSVINVKMAAAVREVSVKQGFDPRDFPLVVAGGAGPNHACMIALELEIPVMIIPKESSIFCAAGMLIKAEGIPQHRIEHIYALDLRYLKQYHEVNVEISSTEIQRLDLSAISARFHKKHNALFGYSLEEEQTPVELINLRIVCIGQTRKPEFQAETLKGSDPSKAYKKTRKAFLPLQRRFEEIDVFDGDKLSFGNKIVGPALIEQVNTTTFVTPEYNLLVDKYGSYTMYMKSSEEEVTKRVLN
jgi:N-methylhydantoinase A